VSVDTMTDFIATGGRFPILIVTHTRAEMLNRTLASLLLTVRCVQTSDIVVVQDGNSHDVQAVAGGYRGWEWGMGASSAELPSFPAHAVLHPANPC